jgi:hypothetical protein
MLAAVVAVSAATLAGATAAAAASKPTVSKYNAKPDTLQSKGGSVHLEATTTDSKTCTFSSDETIKGLPTTIPCPGGFPGITVTIPANSTNSVKNISFTLKATASNGDWASATLFVHEEPLPAAITSFTASSSQLPASGGKVTLTGKMVRANACIISVSPSVSGLPQGFTCTSGTVTKTVTLPATTSGTQASYVFNLSASGLGAGTANKQVTVFVSAQDPTVTDFTATPSTLPDSGGTVTLSVKVSDAVGCNFGEYFFIGGDPKGTNPVSNLPASIKCTAGTYTFKATVIPDTSAYVIPGTDGVGEEITFEMTVNSQSDNVAASNMPVVDQAAAPPS